MILDSDILIWYFRGNPKANRFIVSLQNFSMTAITYMELLQGMRNKSEQRMFINALKRWKCPVLPINEAITYNAMAIVERDALSHGVEVADAIIASIALHHQKTLATANAKHFRIIKGLAVKLFRP